MGEWRQDRIGSALRGKNPSVLTRLTSGFVCIGDTQFLPGYCVLLCADPAIDRLTDLPRSRRLEFLADMDLLGEAVRRVCSRRDPEFRRINYQILGNLDEYLHAHVHARYHWEPAEFARGPMTRYPVEVRNDETHQLGPQHDALRADLLTEITALTTEYRTAE